jgi:hypothetical protein
LKFPIKNLCTGANVINIYGRFYGLFLLNKDICGFSRKLFTRELSSVNYGKKSVVDNIEKVQGPMLSIFMDIIP